MKAFATSALCATLVVPALIQPAMANFDATGNAQRYLISRVSSQVRFAKIAQAVADKKTSAEEGAKQIEKLTADFQALKTKMDNATPAEKLAVERLSAMDPTNTKKNTEAAAKATKLITTLKATNFGGNTAMQKSCTDFAKLFGYTL